jgi:hypothetical protein
LLSAKASGAKSKVKVVLECEKSALAADGGRGARHSAGTAGPATTS